MTDFVASLAGKKVLVFGVGRQGGGSGDAQFLTKHGAVVRLSDSNTSLVPEGQTQEQVDWAELIIKNPGVSDDHPLLIHAKEKRIEVATSIALYVANATIPVIGITGTRGKSTTTALISSLLELVYPGQIITGGNIPGISGLSLLDLQVGKKYAVLELSSFQLHDFHTRRISPPYAVITNLYHDHLNRYPDMQSYQADKTAICCYQKPSNHCIFHANNEGAVAIASTSPAQKHSFIANDVINWETKLPGVHNRENLAAMWALSQVLGITIDQAQQVAKNFETLPYRQQVIREVNNTTFINDTTATTPTAAIKAILTQTKPTILICGGASKNLPFNELIEVIANTTSIVGVVILGSIDIPEFTNALKLKAGNKILGQVDKMCDAVKLAFTHALPYSSILLSPGFASFDLFQNEFDRGSQFNNCVSEL